MKINTRNGIALTAVLALFSFLTLAGQSRLHADEESTKGKLTQESLGNLLESLNLKPTTLETRYDFRFKANHDEAWALSMSAVLSNDGESIWIMAWLDELPSSAREVPRVALLRLLAGNRRFVLQRVVPNREMTTAKFVNLLKDLGKTVADTHGHWNVASWTEKPESKDSETKTAAAKGRSTDKRTTPASGTRSPKRTSAKPRRSTKVR